MFIPVVPTIYRQDIPECAYAEETQGKAGWAYTNSYWQCSWLVKGEEWSVRGRNSERTLTIWPAGPKFRLYNPYFFHNERIVIEWQVLEVFPIDDSSEWFGTQAKRCDYFPPSGGNHFVWESEVEYLGLNLKPESRWYGFTAMRGAQNRWPGLQLRVPGNPSSEDHSVEEMQSRTI